MGTTYLISPSEPEEIKNLGIVSSIPEEYGVDILGMVLKEEVVKIGIQRKTAPEDLYQSIQDGRLSKEVNLMKVLDVPVIVIEGSLRFDSENRLINPRIPKIPYRITKKGIRNLFRSCWTQFGILVEYSDSVRDTIEIMEEWVGYIRKEKHRSLFHRPKVKGEWGIPSPRERELFFYQGLPGIGEEIARNILDRVSSPKDLVNMTLEELMEIPLLGKGRAEKIYKFLRREDG